MTLPFFFVCVCTWYAPMWYLAFYLVDTAYAAGCSKFQIKQTVQSWFGDNTKIPFAITLIVRSAIAVGYAVLFCVVCVISPLKCMYIACPALVWLFYVSEGRKLNGFVLKFVSDCKATFHPPSGKDTEEK